MAIRPEEALISFGQLLGMLNAGGSVEFTWFFDPLNNSLNGIPDHREFLLKLLRALLGHPADDPPQLVLPGGNLIWEPINIVTDSFDAGLIWNNDSAPLQLGVGARVALGSGKQHFDLAVLARLLKFTHINGGFPNQVSTEFGQFRITGILPIPDFLESADITADLIPGAPKVFSLGLNVKAPNKPQTHFDEPNPQVVWDCARLAILVIRAWVASQAANGNFFTRVDGHLFPMLGADAGAGDPIQPFPLIGDTPGTAPQFSPWQNSIFTFSNNGAGALTFLWHLRCLITGTESKDLFSGSYYFPLVGGPPNPGLPPLPGFPDFHNQGNYENTPHPNSVFLGVTSEGGTIHTLVLDLHNAAGMRKRIQLAKMNGGFSRPQLPTASDWTDLVNFATGFHQFSIGDSSIEVANEGGALAITLFKKPATSTPPQPLDGEYQLQLLLRSGESVSFRMQTPMLAVELPPKITPAEQATLFIGLLNWILSVAGPQDPAIQTVIQALSSVISDAIQNKPVAPAPLLMSLLDLLGDNGLLNFGPFALAVNQNTIEPSIKFGPFKPGDLGMPIHIGTVEAKAGIDTSNGQLMLAQVSLYDLRFGEGGGAGQTGGLLGSLLPDTRQVPGFTISVAMDLGAPLKFRVTGGGKIPLQESIGPLDLAGLLVDLRADRILVGVDLSFKLAVITVAAYELGVEFPFTGELPTPFLHGLGLSMDIPAVKLAGMFAKIKNGDQEDYVGGAVVRVLSLFQLSAIGGYTQITSDPTKDSMPSLFIFASLVAPLGGPPWFFITGIAGGFGYNRTLPPPGLLTEHPFIQVMRGDLPLGADSAASLATLGTYFAAVAGQHWVAGGIQFTAFGFINGKLVVSIAFGNKFSIQVLGLAAFGIEHIAYFEIGIEASADEEAFKLKAGLSKNSYLIHPDIFSLSGEFALGIWHSGEHAGDFVLSIGGYHPYFHKPKHYDDVAKVSVRCTVYGFLRLVVECFFACTPQALMAGASVSLSAEFAGIGCGLDLYIDVYIEWDPFYIRAGLGIALWFEFWGRHEISVDLQIWTPPFGGIATIDLAIVSFDVDFGSGLKEPPPPPLFQFIGTHLQIPADQDGDKAKVAAFNTDDVAGLFRIDFIAGRTTKPQADTSKQEGIGTPVSMASEFAFTAKTRLPMNYAMVTEPGVAALQGKINVPLCDLYNMGTNFNVTYTNLDLSPKIDKYLKDMFPAADFGGKVVSAQNGARQAVAEVATDQPSVALSDGFSIRCEALLAAPPDTIKAKAFEDSGPDEEYPLPFELPAGMSFSAVMPNSRLSFKVGAKYPTLKSAATLLSSRDQAELMIKNWKPTPLKVTARTADLQRFQIGVRLRGLTVVNPPTDAPVIGVPPSPPRRAELFPVSLRVLTPKATTDLRRRRLETVSRARNLKTRVLTAATGTPSRLFATTVSVAPGTVQILELEGSEIKSHKLTFSGQQSVRAIFLGEGDDFLSETYVKGSMVRTAPAEARRVALFGEGLYPAVMLAGGLTNLMILAALENVGIEHDTTLTALGGRTFAGHGCVLECKSRTPFPVAALDAVPGFEVLRNVKRLRLYFPTAGANASVVISVAPLDAQPGPALDEVRWVAIDASLKDLTTLVGPDSTAFVMTVTAPGSWLLEIDLGRKWRLTQVVVCRQTARDMVNLLRSQIEQDLIDDRFEKSAETFPASTVALEVTQ